jgi:thiosulfate dehydrogenase [quinone] large subunit
VAARARQLAGEWSAGEWFAGALAWFRLAYGAYWIQAAAWKVPPDFGRASDTGLWHWIRLEAEHPLWEPYGLWLERFVIPHFTAVAWAVLAWESFIAIALLTGRLTRWAAVAGLALVANIAVGVLGVPGEGAAFYLILAVGFLVVLFSPHGVPLRVKPGSVR